MNTKTVPTVVGIDIGASTAKIAAVVRGTVDVITNQANFRETPSIVGFGEGQRKLGQAGNNKLKSNFKNTISAPHRYLGLNAMSQQSKIELANCLCKTNIKDNKLTFKVDMNGKEQNFTPEQVMAAFLTQLSQTISHNNLDDKLVVLSVPSFFTETQKKAILNAAEISGAKNVKLVTDTIAIGLDYGSFKKSEMAQGKNIVFVDFGYSKLSVSLIKFTESKMEVILQKSNRNIGCRNIDQKIFEYIAKKFLQSKGLDLSENKKATLKLLEVIQRQRKILSGISQTDISIECLMEDQDISQPFTREILFNKSIQVFHAISELLNQFKEQVSKMSIQIDAVELVGGGTRIPKVIETIEQIFGMNSSRTINSSQTVARGATLAAVQQSGLFRFHCFKVDNKSTNCVKFAWKQAQGDIKQAQPILNINQSIPCQKTIKMQTTKPTEIFIYQNSVEQGNKIARIQCETPTNKDEISIKFSIDENGFTTVSSVKDKQNANVKFIFEELNGLPKKQIQEFKAKQRQMFVKDYQIVKSYQKKNDLEAFVYKQKQQLGGQEIKKYATAQQISKVERFLDEITQKLGNSDQSMNINYDNQKNQINGELNKLNELVKRRKGQIALHLKDLTDLKSEAAQILKQITQRFRNTKLVSEVYEQIKEIQNWAEQAIKVSKRKNVSELPVVKKQQIDQKRQNIKILVQELTNPKPQMHSQPQAQQMPRQTQAFPNMHQQQAQQGRRKQQQQFDPFGMSRSGFFGPNNFFGNMGGFF